MYAKLASLKMALVLVVCGASALADDIKVPKQTWDAISESDKARIQDTLKAAKLLNETDKITAVSGMPEGALAGNPIKDICRAICDATAATAAASCAGSTVAIVACMAAVGAARDLCRRRC